MTNSISIINWPDPAGNGAMDVIIDGGQIVGTTLVVPTSGGGTVNLNLQGAESVLDFALLTPMQEQALIDSIKGEMVFDLAGNSSGYLLKE